MRTGVTLEDVTRAADELLERGERPTVEGVRRTLGTGSPATVNGHLTEYFKTLPKRLHLPAPIALAAGELFEKIQASAQAAADERERAGQLQLERAQTQLAADRAAFEEEREALRSQVATLSSDLSAAREASAQLQTLLEARQVSIADLTARTSAADTRAQAAIEERERASQNHHSEIERLKERADGNERHLLTQVEALRAQLKQAQTDREREHQLATKRASDAEAAATKATEAAALLQRHLTARDAELAHERHSLEIAHSALEAARAAHERESNYQRERHAQVAGERDEANARAARLQIERDQQAQDASVLKGRCAVLSEQLDQRGPQ